MHKIKNKNVPHIFLKLFSHAYPTNFSLINLSVPRTFLKTIWFPIPVRGIIGTIGTIEIMASQNTKKKLITFYCSKNGLKKK